MASPRFRFAGPSLMWRCLLITPRVSVLSDEPLRIDVFADSAGLPIDPSAAAYVAQVATTVQDAENPVTWHAATWDTTVIGGHVAQVNVGATGLALAVGNYYVWIKITNTSPVFSLVSQVGKVIVE